MGKTKNAPVGAFFVLTCCGYLLSVLQLLKPSKINLQKGKTKMAKIAINGFGRIGRLLFRQIFGSTGIEIVAVNDLGDLENLAYLLKYDTAYGKYARKVEIDGTDLVVDGTRIKVLQMKDPATLPWKDLNVDVAVEATGFFESFEKASVHLTAGAKRVVLTAPAKDEDGVSGGKTVLMGINEGELSTCNISSNASCTTNSASPVIQVLNEKLGISKAILSTIHAYTATQNLVDGPTKGKDFRKGRAGAQNITPATTGAAIAVGRAVKELAGKFDGISLRVPIVTGSLADITFVSKRSTTVEEVISILEEDSKEPRWQGILSVTHEQLVSSDIVGELSGALVDLSFTKVVDGDLVKILSWYDNEAGYVSTLIRHIKEAIKFI